MEFYTQEEWENRIASFGRTVDIRNFPDLAADVLLGEKEVFLGLGTKLKKKYLNPSIIPAIAFWTKGPVRLLGNNEKLIKVLELYREKEAVINLQLTVTGFGGTFLEPGIQEPEEVCNDLKDIFSRGLIDPEAVVIRYDPIIKVKMQDKILTNASEKSFKKVITPFAAIGVKWVETKFLLIGNAEKEKYDHVRKRMENAKVMPIQFSTSEIREILSMFKHVCEKELGVDIFTCCVGKEQGISNWPHDLSCLSYGRLTKVGKKLFGEHWDRISLGKRSSREGCLCTAYWDLSNVEGHKKCGSQDAACIYCTASSKDYSAGINQKIEQEKETFLSCRAEDKYAHLIS